MKTKSSKHPRLPLQPVRHGQLTVYVLSAIALIVVAVGIWAYSSWSGGASQKLLARMPDVDTDHLSARAQKVFQSCEESVRINPQDPSAWGLLGRVSLAHQFQQEARTCFEVAAELEPQNFEWYYGQALAETDPAKSIPLVEQAIEVGSGQNDFLHCKLAEWLFDEAEYERCESVLESLLESSPSNLRANLLMARLRLIQNQLDAALHCAQLVEKGQPNRKELLRLLSQIHSRRGNSAKANEYATKAGREDTFNPAWYDPVNEKIFSLRKDINKVVDNAMRLPPQMIDKRIEVLRDAVEEEPHEPNWHGFLGQTLLKARKLKEAEQALTKGVELHPNSAILHYSLGLVYLNQKMLEDSIVSLRNAVRIKPDFDAAFLDLGIALREDKQLDQSIEAIQKSIEILPGNLKAHLNLAFTLELAGRDKEAIESYRECLKLNSQSAEVYYLLGKQLAKKPESHAEARKMLQQALAIEPRLEEASKLLQSLN